MAESKLITHFKPQIELIITDKISHGYTAGELQESLSNHQWWWSDSIYKKVKLHLDNADMTIVGWCNAVEGITGSDSAFLDELRSCFNEVIGSMEYAEEVQAQDDQRELHHEHKVAV